MAQLARRRIRLQVDAAKDNSLDNQVLDVYTQASPTLPRGNDVQFEIGIFHDDVLQSVANLDSLTLNVVADDDRDGTPVMTKTLSAGELDDTLAAGTWSDGTKQHALLAFTAQETNLDMSGANEATYWLAIGVVTTDGSIITIGWSKLVVWEDGINADGPAPTLEPIYYTADQCDARFLQRNADGAGWRWGSDGWPEYYFPDGNWRSIVPQMVGGNPTFAWSDPK